MTAALLTAVQAYKDGLAELQTIVQKTESAIVSESSQDLLVSANVNFFAKSFLISICAHLEMCIKDIVFAVATELDRRLAVASIPTTIIEWRYSQKKKGESPGQQIQTAGIGMTKKEIDDLVSGNVHKTKDALARASASCKPAPRSVARSLPSVVALSRPKRRWPRSIRWRVMAKVAARLSKPALGWRRIRSTPQVSTYGRP